MLRQGSSSFTLGNLSLSLSLCLSLSLSFSIYFRILSICCFYPLVNIRFEKARSCKCSSPPPPLCVPRVTSPRKGWPGVSRCTATIGVISLLPECRVSVRFMGFLSFAQLRHFRYRLCTERQCDPVSKDFFRVKYCLTGPGLQMKWTHTSPPSTLWETTTKATTVR